MDHPTSLKITISLVFYILGLVIFILGFIPSKVNKLDSFNGNSLHSICIEVSKSEELCELAKINLTSRKFYDKFVLIIIDALRADFVPTVLENPEFKTSMPFTESSIKNKRALSLINQVHSPTVTMPRIKTLVTGGISNFMDVIMNLNAAELNEDNLILQATQNNKNVIFYGDDTWIKLFPNHFLRKEGTHSFFVSDFKEVDDNVTWHIPRELVQKDWDLMILHYLGVDHIGHSLGPSSPHLISKLMEMDGVIENIYSNLTALDGLLIVTGDHGMTSGGSHGGITKSEVLTPLIFIRTKNAEYTGGNSIQTVSQVDFAPTMSILMGLLIPANSFGCIIPSVLQFSGLTRKQILTAAVYNLLQLVNVHKAMHLQEDNNLIETIKITLKQHFKAIKSSKSDLSDKEFSHLIELYMNLLNKLKQKLLATVSGYSTTSITTGIILMWLSLPYLMSCFLNLNSKSTPGLDFSYIYKINIVTLPLFFLVYMLASNYLYLLFIPVEMLIFFSLVLTAVYVIQSISLSVMEKVCIFIHSLHAISMFSSSFIEEEHQVWYFSVSTIFTLLFIEHLYSVISQFLRKPIDYGIGLKQLGKLVTLNENLSATFHLFFLLIIHRVTRNWNQTGNKWQHLPDISDWLNKESNIYNKFMLVISSQILIVLYLKESPLTFTLMCLGSIFIFLYKYQSETTSLILQGSNIDAIVFSWLGYIVILMIIVLTFYRIFSQRIKKNIPLADSICALVLLSQLIGRVHNIPLIASVLIQEYLTNKLLHKYNRKLLTVSIYLQSAMCSFFYQGNSNSLSSIDVYSGYTGLLSYKPAISGVLITINTYSSVILWFMLLVYRISSNKATTHLNERKHIMVIFGGIVIYKLLIVAVYCIVMDMMKHHLFVLSVFAPKLFYEICHLLFFLFFIICIVIFSAVTKGKIKYKL